MWPEDPKTPGNQHRVGVSIEEGRSEPDPEPPQLTALQDRRLDVGFVRSALATPPLIVTAVDEEPFQAVLPADHRLAALAEVPLAALAEEPSVLWPRRASTGFYDRQV